MGEGKFLSVGFTLRQAWKGFKDNLTFFLIATLVYFLGFGVHFYYSGHYEFMTESALHHPHSPLLIFAISILYMIFVFFMLLGFFRASLDVVRGGKATWSAFASSPSDVWSFFIGTLLFYITIIVGTLLLIFPAIIWGTKFSLYPFLIVDKKAGGMESLQLSAVATNGAKWDLLGFYLVLFLLSLGAIFTVFLGLFILFPLWSIGKASLYNSLTKE